MYLYLVMTKDSTQLRRWTWGVSSTITPSISYLEVVLLRMTGATDTGRRRKANQDSIFFDEPGGIAIVADGIGGRSGGEIASSLAVNSLRKAFVGSDRIHFDEIPSFLASSIQSVNREIYEKSQSEPGLKGMGTTLNCIVFSGSRAFIAHIGDSRTYIYQKGNLFQLTLDHNVENFLARGMITPQLLQPGAKPEALVRALGLSMRCDPEIYEIDFKPGQIFLTCSDGLSSMVSDKEICKIILENESFFDDLPRTLINKANQKGGRDNITVLMTRIEGKVS